MGHTSAKTSDRAPHLLFFRNTACVRHESWFAHRSTKRYPKQQPATVFLRGCIQFASHPGVTDTDLSISVDLFSLGYMFTQDLSHCGLALVIAGVGTAFLETKKESALERRDDAHAPLSTIRWPRSNP